MLANINHVLLARVLRNIHPTNATVPTLLSMERIVAKVKFVHFFRLMDLNLV